MYYIVGVPAGYYYSGRSERDHGSCLLAEMCTTSWVFQLVTIYSGRCKRDHSSCLLGDPTVLSAGSVVFHMGHHRSVLLQLCALSGLLLHIRISLVSE